MPKTMPITSECSNIRVTAFVEEEDEACDEFGREQEDEEKVAYADKGLSIVV